MLTISTSNGRLISLLAALPMVFDFNRTRVLYLTSVLEMSVVDINRQNPPVKVDLETEPALCALGPSHAAVAMNNRVWFYALVGRGGQMLGRRDYMGSVQKLAMNETHAAVLIDGRVVVHPIDAAATK